MPRPDPLFQNLLAELRSLILKSYAPGQALPSQRALADMYGVGQTTAHRALAALEKEGLIDVRSRFHWRRRIEINGRKTAQTDRPLKIAVITRRNQLEIRNAWTYQLLRQKIEQRGWEVVLVPNLKMHHPTPGRNVVDLRRVPWNACDVALLFEVEDAATLGNPILKKHPVLALDLDATTFGLESVSFDDHGAGRYVAKYLFDLGHRRFALTDEVNGPGWPADAACMQRSVGFQAEIGRLGGCIRPEYRIAFSRKGNGEYKGLSCVRNALDAWMALPPRLRPTALFAIDLSLAARLMEALQHHGISVPRDLSIITVSWSEAFLPGGVKLTRVHVDFERLVVRALDLASGLPMRTNAETTPTLHMDPILLVPGETTAPPKQISR
jgi:DNA-binding LacI/PurR family transcriptional regulator